MILYKVFQRNKTGILASVVWHPNRACPLGLVYDSTLSDAFLDQLSYSRVRREGQVFFPPEGWGPFAAFKGLKEAQDFAKDAFSPGTTWEVWLIEAQPSTRECLWTQKGGSRYVTYCPTGTVLVDSFRLLSRVDVKQKEPELEEK